MDSLTINAELQKIQNIHSSLDEHNPITFIIFLETFRQKLSPEQIRMIESRIENINNKFNNQLNDFLQTRDEELMKTPLLLKTEESGVMVQGGNAPVCGSEC